MNKTMTITSTYKKLILIALAVVITAGAFLVYALAGFWASPIEFDSPPAFVEQYADKFVTEEFKAGTLKSNSSEVNTLEINISEVNTPEANASKAKTSEGYKKAPWKQAMTFSSDEELILEVILGGKSSDIIMQLFTHPNKAQRVKIASAFALLNVKLTHHEESGFSEKRNQFWKVVEKQIPHIQNGLYEALITSAETGGKSYIPYTLAWMPGQGRETVEVLAWAAKHHPDPWVRRFSVFFVVEYGNDEALANLILQSGVNDPEYQVRKEVLAQRLRRLKAIFVGEQKEV